MSLKTDEVIITIFVVTIQCCKASSIKSRCINLQQQYWMSITHTYFQNRSIYNARHCLLSLLKINWLFSRMKCRYTDSTCSNRVNEAVVDFFCNLVIKSQIIIVYDTFSAKQVPSSASPHEKIYRIRQERGSQNNYSIPPPLTPPQTLRNLQFEWKNEMFGHS